MLTAGQNSGNLDGAFAEMVKYLEWQEDLKAQTGQALVYPAILTTGVIGLFMMLSLFVIPRFRSIFMDSGFELPMLTQRVLAVGDFMGHWWWLIMLLAIMATVGYKAIIKTNDGLYYRDLVLLRIPVIGIFIHKLALSRFARNFSVLLASGVDLLKVLDLLPRVIGNAVLSRQITNIRNRVASGESLNDSFNDASSFPTLVRRLVAVGEKTGSLDTSLIQAADFYDKEIPRDLKKAFALLEAVIVVVLGLLVCVAALSLLMPIMQIKGSM